ncbi:MAG: peptide chain release factor 1 [Phycisphaerae bacterium]|nr:MAG: peptide chain release factor 1 [Phycisphaerae bacterium]
MAQTVDDKLLAKLDELSKRREQLDAQMADPEIATDHNRITALAKESGKLRYLTDPYRELCGTIESLEEARALVHDSSADADLRELAQEELPDLEAEYARQMELLKDRVVSADDAAISSLILEVRAGTGGDEAALFARDLYEMYLRYAQLRRFKVEVLDQSIGDKGGLKEIVLNIRGDGAWQTFGYEGGGHRVQRVPETEAQGRIHTSAATVAVFPEPEEVSIDINWDSDVEEHVTRSSGPGGQKVNKTSSAILLVHPETGITVSMQDEKSQHKNRAKARRIMTTRILDYHQKQQSAELDSARKTMIGSGDRSQRIRTYNFPQNRCTDHRIGLTLYSLDRVMLGQLDELVEALQTHDKEQRLQNL